MMIILSLFLYLNSVKLGLSVVVVLIDDDFVVMAFAVVYSFSLILLGGGWGVGGWRGWRGWGGYPI